MFCMNSFIMWDNINCRKGIESEDQVIKTTITAGIEPKNKNIKFNKLNVAADEKLYIGKKKSKNRVIK